MQREPSKPTIIFVTFLLLLALTVGCAPIPTPMSEPVPSLEPQSADAAETPTELPEDVSSVDVLERQVGFEIREPASVLSEGYVLENTSMHEATQSVCLQYRYAEGSADAVLFVAQGPADLAPPLELVPGWPEYALLNENISLGGAEDSLQLSGWQRNDWACSEAAQAETTRYSYALAPRLAWETGDQQFELYSASGGCGTPGGLTNLDLVRIAEELTGTSTHGPDELDPECLGSIADAAKLAGFEIREPTDLPENVSFYFATYEEAPTPAVTLLFLHDEHPDMGRFFQITEAKEQSPFFTESCHGLSNPCETILVGNTAVVYQTLGPNEQLDWQSEGIFFSLFRSAGEPGKLYKEELLKVVEGLQ